MKIQKIHVHTDPRISRKVTRQVCNLFHNLWNNSLLGLKTVKRLQKSAKVNKIAEEGKKMGVDEKVVKCGVFWCGFSVFCKCFNECGYPAVVAWW